MKIRVSRSFVPPEAHRIAASFDNAAREADRLAGQLSNVSNTLETTWEGNSKNNFMADFRSEPGNLHSYAAYLRKCAQQIREIRVTVWEWKEVLDKVSGRGYGGGGGGSW